MNRFRFSFIIRTLVLATLMVWHANLLAKPQYQPRPGEGDDIEIVVGDNKTIFEYRTNGILMMIKVVPRKGKPYYLVPADGSPHFRSLDHSKKLYPQWVILEW